MSRSAALPWQDYILFSLEIMMRGAQKHSSQMNDIFPKPFSLFDPSEVTSYCSLRTSDVTSQLQVLFLFMKNKGGK